MEATHWLVMGPGGRSKIVPMDQVKNAKRSESHSEDAMDAHNARRRIAELERRVEELKGEEPDSGGSAPAFKPTQPYYAESDGDGEDGESTNEAGGTEGAGASGGFMETTPYYDS